jgi:hypothetical protein
LYPKQKEELVKKFLTLGVLCVLAVFLAGCSKTEKAPAADAAKPPAAAEVKPAPAPTGEIGMPKDLGAFAVTLNTIDIASTIKSPLGDEQAEAGQVFVVIAYTVKNKSQDKPIFFGTAVIKNPAGAEFKNRTLSSRMAEGEVEPGQEKTGSFAFQIPGNASLDLSGYKIVITEPISTTQSFVEFKLK